jgi:hypothetical protein
MRKALIVKMNAVDTYVNGDKVVVGGKEAIAAMIKGVLFRVDKRLA